MKAELVEHWGTDLTAVNAARVSMDKEGDWEYKPVRVTSSDKEGRYVAYPKKVLSIKDTKLVHYLAKHKHTSCFEHQGATLRLKVPIFIARQIQRHRTFSYNEISRRYVDSEPEFYWPDKWRKRADNVKQGSSDEELPFAMDEVGMTLRGEDIFLRDYEYIAVSLYQSALSKGMAPELARMILPQNMYTEFYMTGNLRSWNHFLSLRLDKHAQKEVRDIAEQIDNILTPLWPVSMAALREHSS